jgi:YD repeat-containing protein
MRFANNFVFSFCILAITLVGIFFPNIARSYPAVPVGVDIDSPAAPAPRVALTSSLIPTVCLQVAAQQGVNKWVFNPGNSSFYYVLSPSHGTDPNLFPPIPQGHNYNPVGAVGRTTFYPQADCGASTGPDSKKVFQQDWACWTGTSKLPGGVQCRTQINYCGEQSNASTSGSNCVCNNPQFPFEDAHAMKCVGGAALSTKANGHYCNQPKQGNPCNPATGIKTQLEAIYRSAGESPLELNLVYNSRLTADPFPVISGTYGAGWSGSFNLRLAFAPNGSVGAFRDDGRKWSFNKPTSGNVYTSDGDISDKLTRLVSGTVTIGWTLVSASGDQTESYDASGKLLAISNRNGLIQSMSYSDAATPVVVAPAPGLLVKVTDNFGREIQFNYDAKSRVAKVIDKAGQQISLAYDVANNLNSITFADSTVRIYHYNESANTSGANLPNHLTGITDERGVRFSTYQYDAQGRTVLTEHSGGAGRYAFL